MESQKNYDGYMEPGTNASSAGEFASPLTDPKQQYHNYQNVNVVGGINQHSPVQIMLTGSNDGTADTLACDPENVWSQLKKRPLAFHTVSSMIKLLLLFNDRDLDEVAKMLNDEGLFARFKAAFGTELNIPANKLKFSELTEIEKGRIASYLSRISHLNRGNAKLEYAGLKHVVYGFITNNYVQTELNFNHLGNILGNDQLNYIQKMYEVLDVNAPDNIPVNMIELIWSYWMEEGMLVQTMNAISRRFQNIRNGDRDPLVNLAIDPLRGASNLLWGYIQDANNRLTVQRRSYEYDNQYGLRLYGSAIPKAPSADSRSKFIGAFNNLLVKCGVYYKQTDNLTIKADAFPILNALQELHLVLAEGANNQFGNLPTEARIEMMVEQQILAREEIREFLNGRLMVPYKEEWMGRVDAMKKLQRWDTTGITHFYDLANFGELLILGIRYVNWMDVNSSDTAGAWATFFRNEIQKYIFSYRAVTGVDLSSETSSTTDERNTIPGILIQQKRNKR